MNEEHVKKVAQKWIDQGKELLEYMKNNPENSPELEKGLLAICSTTRLIADIYGVLEEIDKATPKKNTTSLKEYCVKTGEQLINAVQRTITTQIIREAVEE